MNRNFASIDANRKFTFAPDGVIYNGRFHTRPTAEMYAANGYLPFLDERPVETGYTFSPLDTATERDGVLYRDYERTAETLHTIIVSKAKVESVIDEMGKTASFVAWLNGKAQYFGAWMRGGDEIEYDPMSNSCDLHDLILALGVSAEHVPELIKRVEVV